jgi:hypothetical protein
MNKIIIKKISKEVCEQNGFDNRGCYGTPCNDSCCIGGCDVDKESYDLIMENRKDIEQELGIKSKKFFKGKWSNDKDYLGENSIESQERTDGQCVFHLAEGKGCVLYKLVNEKKINRRMIPTICRVYPLNWDNGLLYIDGDMEKTCNCTCNQSKEKILKTQEKELDDVFDINTSS